MIKSITDIEQSKRLAKILPIESADYTWSQICIAGDALGIPDKQQYSLLPCPFKFYGSTGIPAWSLVALLGAIPSDKVCVKVLTCYYGDYYTRVCYYDEDENAKEVETEAHNNAVDACVELIEKLHKEGLL